MSYTPITDRQFKTSQSNKQPKSPTQSIVIVLFIVLFIVFIALFFNNRRSPNSSESSNTTSASTESNAQLNTPSNAINEQSTESVKTTYLSQDEAEKAPAEIQFKWGLQYAKGNGVIKNDSMALEWWRRSAEKGYVKAQVNLAWAYEVGMGIEKDYYSAFTWYRKAAEQQDAIAQNKLGVFYENGISVEKNMIAALEWYRKAALQGLADAQNKLGIIYAQGINEESVIDNNPHTNKPIAPYMEQSIHIAKDETAAVEWFKKAANQGDIDAQYNLALMYANGMGTDKNELQAYFWSMLSGEKGNKNAQQLNDVMAERLTPEQKTQANITAQNWVSNLNR